METKEDQAKAASDLAAAFKAATGAPLMVNKTQMKYFREAGVDCSNLMEYPDPPGILPLLFGPGELPLR